jgi:ferric iron reductase protein FhuF
MGGHGVGTVDFRQLEERFPLTLNRLENTVLTVPASDLLIEENMGLLIHTYGPLIKARERSAAAAFFMSWFAGVCGAMQHMLISGNEQLLDLSLSNLSVQLYAGDHYPLFSFQINEARFSSIPIIDRDSWCKKTLDTFYTDNVTPFIQILSSLTQMNAIPLWGQIVNALYAQKEEDLAEAPDEESRNRIIYHFKMLTHGVKASAFGLRKNPFDIELNFTQHPNDPAHKMLVKTACCLAYCLDSEFGNCYDCPRLKEKDRALMRVGQS